MREKKDEQSRKFKIHVIENRRLKFIRNIVGLPTFLSLLKVAINLE